MGLHRRTAHGGIPPAQRPDRAGLRRDGDPPEKIFLGLSNYGYDWPLPFVQGVTRAPSISNQRAIELAIEHDVAIQYDETAQAPPSFTTPQQTAQFTRSGLKTPAVFPPVCP